MLNKDRNQSVMELKKVETFYLNLCNDTNDETLQCHSLILPYEKPMLQSIYNGYLDPSNPEVLGNQHPKCPVAPILQKHAPAFLMHLVKLRNIMVKHLTKSGTHTTDAFKYCDTVM
jgi:hypothetical protein